jgi:galactokinase/mevalonate kinase-like predicted kinase
VLALDLDAAGVRVERPLVDPARVEESLLLVDAGPGRGPGRSDWDVIKGQIDGDEAVRQALAEIASLARQAREALVAGRFEDVIALMAQEWEARKRLGPGVTTPGVDRVVEIVSGAGGAAQACDSGGVVTVWTPPGGRGPGRREAVLAALRESGLRLLPARVDLRGLDVEDVA